MTGGLGPARVPARGLVVLLAFLAALTGCGGPKRLPPVATGPMAVSRLRPAAPALLGIGLAERAPLVAIRPQGPSVLKDADRGVSLATAVSPDTPVICRPRGGQVAWTCGSDSGLVARLLVRPHDPDDLLGFDRRLWRGDLLVFATPGGDGLTVVDNVALEDYLRGVVPWEIGRHGEGAMAALEAQAVAARTYTVSHLGERADHGFDLFADVMDQVYRGATDEDPLCNRAIAATRGLVLSADGELVEAYYSACCGGVSSNIEEVWPRPARSYLVSRPDAPGRGDRPYCADYRYYAWTQAWTGDQLTAILQKTLPTYVRQYGSGARGRWAGVVFSPRGGTGEPTRPGRLRSLEILRRTSSGRVADLAVGTDAGTYHVRGDRVRWVLAPEPGTILRSALFDLEVQSGEGFVTAVTARGHGYGHGIGMCQAGALAMAAAGRSVQEILEHYYRGVRLVKLQATAPTP